MLLYVFVAAIVALLFGFWRRHWIMSQPQGSEKMKEISGFIHAGAMTFLNSVYRVLLIFIVVVAVLLTFFIGVESAAAFVFGAILSAIAGNIGMRTSTSSNARTAEGAKESLDKGFRIAFASGTVMGMAVVGLGLGGLVIAYYFLQNPSILFAFGFGASSIALFARVGGGIYTKAADVGADLAGKVEEGIPEDDPRNPAVIADNVGDNVGDVAGMGADLFESYVDSIIAAMVLGAVLSIAMGAIVPLLLSALGIVASILGTFFVNAKKSDPFKALDLGILVSAIIMAVLSYGLLYYIGAPIGIFYAVLIGLVVALIIGYSTEFVTSPHHFPTISIAKAATTGAGTNVIEGISVGMFSTAIPVITVAAAIVLSFMTAGLFGVAIAAVAMLSILGISLSADTYGSVADNAAGISEMAGMGQEVRKRTEELDAVGNSTAAIGKGFAIASAALTTLALFASYIQITGLTSIDLSKPAVIAGLFLGALVPFLFCAFTFRAVGSAASKVVDEVRRQFREIKGLMEGKAKPDYNKCIGISTNAALRQMIAPILMALIAPVAVGMVLGLEPLGGFLAGSIATGFLLAVFLSNAGGAWDNAKKYIEAGNFGGKGSAAHKAAVVGDTVGDGSKDVSGPSLNVILKLMTIVALLVAPVIL